MSGGPKRLHAEGSRPTTSKRQRGEIPIFPHLSGKLTHSVANDYLQAFEHGHDGRFSQVQWIEPHDGDKRSSVLSSYRMPSSSDSYVDHSVVSENRLELRDSKDNRGTKIETREMKDFYTEARMDSQASKGEKDVLRSESRGDDKDRKSDRESKMDFKVETKIENDGYTVGSSHVNGNEAKENHREQRYTESPSDGAEPWRLSRNNLHSSSEIGREVLATEEREYSEAHEAVGENKIDLKVEDKFKERERKRKDEKHRDWGEKDKDRNDRRNNLQLGSTSTERDEPIREERETERWDRENGPKDKERVKEKERDYVKRERPVVNEKENLHHEKELVDGSVKIPEQENSALEQKKLDVNDGKREKDLDVEGDRHERHARCYDKESNDGCAEGDGATERDREGFGYGIQQRWRILRPRGTTQAANRESHFCSRARDGEGSQGKHEVSSVVYKPGECMQELLKLWKEYEASEEYKNDESSRNGPTLEIRIPAEYVAATNRQVRGSQLWGADIYTDDSDLVAVLMHTGYCRPTASSPSPSIHELCATIRVLPPQDSYTSTLRNSVRSRAWGAAIGCSYRVESCCIVKKGGGTIDLEPCLANMSAVEPTLAPVAVERTMTTRAAASNALRQQRLVREVTIQYNLCNEPWLKYNISVVADKGLKKPLYTSARLKKGEVLYLETQRNRYELCFNGEKTVSNGTMASCQAAEPESEKLPNHTYHGAQTFEKITTDQENSIDVFRWSRCKKPLPQKIMRSIGIPLPVEHLEVLEENLDWEDIQWSQAGVWIAGKAYTLARVHFLSPN